MSKIARVAQKLFGLNGVATDFGVFGSYVAGAPTNSQDPATIQSLSAFLYGWANAVIATNRPFQEERNSLDLLIFYQLAYLLQEGVAEWDSGTTYYENSVVQVSGVLYWSLQDANLNKAPASEVAYWTKVLPAQDGSLLTGLTLAQVGLATYDSGWFAVANNNAYIKTHSLGTTKLMAVIYLAQNSDGSGWCFIVGGAEGIRSSGDNVQTNVAALTTTNATVRTGATYLLCQNDASGTLQQTIQSAYCRLILIKLP